MKKIKEDLLDLTRDEAERVGQMVCILTKHRVLFNDKNRTFKPTKDMDTWCKMRRLNISWRFDPDTARGSKLQKLGAFFESNNGPYSCTYVFLPSHAIKALLVLSYKRELKQVDKEIVKHDKQYDVYVKKFEKQCNFLLCRASRIQIKIDSYKKKG